MNREFISFDIFNKMWENLGLTDFELKELQEHLNLHPESGKIIKNTGGVRKIRWAVKGAGKRGSLRILYIDFVYYEKIYLLMVYPKNKKEDITEEEKKVIKQLIGDLKKELRRQ